MWYLPTPISSQQQQQSQSQSQSTEECPLNGSNSSTRSLEDLFQTPRSNTPEAANNEPSHFVTPSQNQPLELGTGEEERGKEGGIISGSTEDDIISGGPIMGALSPISEQPRSPTPLEPLFQGGGSPFGDDCDMDPPNRELVGVPRVPPRLATNEAETASRLLGEIDGLSSWEPSPSIHSFSRNNLPPPTSDSAFGLRYNNRESMERHEDGVNTLYKEFDRIHGSRVGEDEGEYGFELLQRLIRTSGWMDPARLGREINRRVRGRSFNWVAKLTKLHFPSFVLMGASGTGKSI